MKNKCTEMRRIQIEMVDSQNQEYWDEANDENEREKNKTKKLLRFVQKTANKFIFKFMLLQQQ